MFESVHCKWYDSNVEFVLTTTTCITITRAHDVTVADATAVVCVRQDLHRTGCSGFSGDENDEERALLKRVLLAYARWNKAIGYCQGFNILAALILDVMERQEDDALKVR